LADAIADAIRNRAEWQRLVPAAREHIEQHFSPQPGIQALESLFTDIAAKRRETEP
jgi:hypothetical protein